ncbi:MAG: hypothetical protein JWR19_4312 [Pedosphaera sp.]|nr:hypothetical protein [Pedosphaera sp.]
MRSAEFPSKLKLELQTRSEDEDDWELLHGLSGDVAADGLGDGGRDGTVGQYGVEGFG